MDMAQSFQARCLAAEAAREAADLALGFQRAARTVRQCLALKSRLQWDAERRERETRAEVEDAQAARAERRKAQVRLAVKRAILETFDSYDADNRLGDLEERLDEDALYDLFAGHDDINVHIARMCEEMGVPGLDLEEAAPADSIPAPLGEVAAKPPEGVPPDPSSSPPSHSDEGSGEPPRQSSA